MLVVAAVNDAAPWWGVPLIAGAFTILGVLATHLTTSILDRTRGRREDINRWHTDRRACYAAYMAAADKLYTSTSLGRWWGGNFENEHGATLAQDAHAAFNAMAISRQDLNLLASPPVRRAAEEVWRLSEQAVGYRASPIDDELFSNHIAKLLDAMRHELGTNRERNPD